MKIGMCACLIIVVLGLENGCQSGPDTNSPPKVKMAPPSSAPTTVAAPEIAVGYDWRGDWGYTDRHIVEMEQGVLAADTLAVCHATLVADGNISNRKRDECDHIAAKGLSKQKKMNADEKRKDEAYDKAHHLAAPK